MQINESCFTIFDYIMILTVRKFQSALPPRSQPAVEEEIKPTLEQLRSSFSPPQQHQQDQSHQIMYQQQGNSSNEVLSPFHHHHHIPAGMSSFMNTVLPQHPQMPPYYDPNIHQAMRNVQQLPC
jgi:hypothetical protein